MITDDSVGWGVYIGVGAGVDSAYGITFWFDDVSDMGSYDGFFGGFNSVKHVVSFINEPL